MFFAAARRQFLLASVLPNIKQKMVSSITASLNLQLNMTCKLLDYTLDSSITGNTFMVWPSPVYPYTFLTPNNIDLL